MTTDDPEKPRAPSRGTVDSSPVDSSRSARDRADDLRAEQRIIFAQTSRRLVESRHLLDRSTARTVQPWAPALT